MSLEGYLRHHFPELKISGKFRYFGCIYCGKDWKLWVNIVDERPWFYCFRCQRSGDQLTFVSDHLGVTRAEALEKIKSKSYDHETVESVALRKLRPPPGAIEYKPISILPREYQPIRITAIARDPIEELAYRYLTKQRKVHSTQIALHRIGYALAGRYDGCVILPVTRAGEIVYFTARAFSHNRFRYLNPKREEVTAGKSEVLFNYDQAVHYEEAELCEGYFDALAIGQHAMAMFGKTLSDAQAAMLLTAKPKPRRIGVRLDEDARYDCYRTVEQLRNLGFDAYPILISGDPGEQRDEPVIRAEASFSDLIRHRLQRP